MVSIATSRDLCGALRRGRQPSRRTQTLQGANQVDYRYNGLGQRVQKFGSSVPTRHYLYNSDGLLVGEYTDAGASVLELVKLGDLPIAVLMPAGTLYAQADHLNTVRALQNAAGVTVWRWESDPFGAALPDEDPDGNGIATVFPLRFPGQYYDAETGTHYNYHRDYDPQMGRYTQVDPLGVAGGLNVYAYVGNDPVRMIDPLGLVECGWWNQNCSFGDPAGAAPRCATAECAAGIAPSNNQFGRGQGASFLIGVAATGMYGPGGVSVEGGFAFDTRLNACRYSQVCWKVGFGYLGAIGGSGSIQAGALCSGASKDSGYFVDGGKVVYGGGSLNENGLTKGFDLGGGLGWGGAIGQQYCTTTYTCMRN